MRSGIEHLLEDDLGLPGVFAGPLSLSTDLSSRLLFLHVGHLLASRSWVKLNRLVLIVLPPRLSPAGLDVARCANLDPHGVVNNDVLIRLGHENCQRGWLRAHEFMLEKGGFIRLLNAHGQLMMPALIGGNEVVNERLFKVNPKIDIVS